MLNTGDYRILYYNHKGALLKSIKHKGASFSQSRAIAEAFLNKSRKKYKKNKRADIALVPVSYTVDRRVFNSLDNFEGF